MEVPTGGFCAVLVGISISSEDLPRMGGAARGEMVQEISGTLMVGGGSGTREERGVRGGIFKVWIQLYITETWNRPRTALARTGIK